MIKILVQICFYIKANSLIRHCFYDYLSLFGAALRLVSLHASWGAPNLGWGQSMLKINTPVSLFPVAIRQPKGVYWTVLWESQYTLFQKKLSILNIYLKTDANNLFSIKNCYNFFSFLTAKILQSLTLKLTYIIYSTIFTLTYRNKLNLRKAETRN